MTKLGVAFALALAASCGDAPPQPKAPQPPPSTTTDLGDGEDVTSKPVPPGGPPIQVSHATSPRAAAEAPPAGNVIALAVTPDGGAALTSDAAGSVRLWPALDGSREPRVVRRNAPVELALARAQGGYLAAFVDESHSLELVELDADGRVGGVRSIGNDPAFAGVTAFGGGVLAWTSDQKVELYDGTGTPRGALGTLPGERIAAIAARGDHAVALLEVDASAGAAHTRVRALVTSPQFAWGDFADAGLEPTVASPDRASTPRVPIALSPDGTRLALAIATAPPTSSPAYSVVVVDVPGKHRIDEIAIAHDIAELAFADDANLAVAAQGSLGWYQIDGAHLRAGSAQTLSEPDSIAATGRAGDAGVVAITNGGLAIATPKRARYLGYAVQAPGVVAAGGAGSLMIAAFAQGVLADAALRGPAATGVLVPDTDRIASLAWLGGDDWLVGGKSGETGMLRVLSTRGDLGTVTLPPGSHGSGTEVLRYEASTHLATSSLGDRQAVFRWDPTHRELAQIAAQPKGPAYVAVQIVPVAPALAGGAKLVRATIRERTTLEWFSDDQLATRVATVDVDSALAFDRAGRVYAWLGAAPHPHVGVIANGREIGELPVAGASRIYPDDTGARVVIVDAAHVQLVAGGKIAWSRELHGIVGLAWLADGAIAVATTTGTVRVDAATGKDAALRCAWGFGFADTPRAAALGAESMCSSEP